MSYNSDDTNGAMVLIKTIANDLKKHVIVKRYPTQRVNHPVYSIPDTIHDTPTVNYVMGKYRLTYDNAKFIVSLLLSNFVVQPGRGDTVIIGNELQDYEKKAVFDITDGNTFHIYGKRLFTVYDPMVVDSTLAVYYSNDDTYVIVHDYICKKRSRKIVGVYYHKDLQYLFNYANLVISDYLLKYMYSRFLTECNIPIGLVPERYINFVTRRFDNDRAFGKTLEENQYPSY